MKPCRSCGAQASDNAVKCRQCGTWLVSSTAPGFAAPPPVREGPTGAPAMSHAAGWSSSSVLAGDNDLLPRGRGGSTLTHEATAAPPPVGSTDLLPPRSMSKPPRRPASMPAPRRRRDARRSAPKLVAAAVVVAAAAGAAWFVFGRDTSAHSKKSASAKPSHQTLVDRATARKGLLRLSDLPKGWAATEHVTKNDPAVNAEMASCLHVGVELVDSDRQPHADAPDFTGPLQQHIGSGVAVLPTTAIRAALDARLLRVGRARLRRRNGCERRGGTSPRRPAPVTGCW